MSARRAMIADVSRLGSGIPLIARQGELRTLRDALRRAREGEPAAVLLSGDAGIGKSRLLSELLTAAEAEGFAVVSGRCLDTAEGSLPYLPFVEAARQLADQVPDLIGRHPALGPLLPDRPANPPGRPRDLDQLQMFNAFHETLGELAAERPLVLAIEDLHWADRSSRDLLAFLASRLTDQRLLVIGTYRSDDMHRRHPLRWLLTEIVRLQTVERLHLEPFGLDDARAFVRLLGNDLDEHTVIRIADACEGNAFLAEELVSASSSVIPRELADVLLARIEWLTPSAQQVMRLASVIGRQFAHELLSTACDLPDAELDAALREAITHNVLVLDDSGHTYAFRHALLREALYTDLLPGERSRLHRQVAAALTEARHPGAAAELAHHSMESHDTAAALKASIRAAREAEDLAAPAEELRHVERALQLWPSTSDPEGISGLTELTLTAWAGTAAGAAGEPDRAIAHGRTAIELVDRDGNALQSAAMRRRYAAYLLRLEGTQQRAYDVITEAWQLVAGTDPNPVKAWVQAIGAHTALALKRYDEAADWASEAIATARAIDGDGEHTAAWADALVTHTIAVKRSRGGTEDVHARFAEATELAERVGDGAVEQLARYQTVLTLHDVGRFDEALAEIDVSLKRAASTGAQWSTYGLELRVLQVMTKFMIGDWDGAEAAAELVGGAASGTVITRVSAPGLLVAVNRGHFDVADRRLAYLRDRWHSDQQVLTVVGLAGAELESWRGKPTEAAGYIEEALRLLQKVNPGHLAALSLCASGIAAYADLAEAARTAGDTAAVTQAVTSGELLTATAVEAMENGRPVSGRIGPEGLAWWQRAQAETSRLRGERDPAPWRATIEAYGYGEPYRQAWAQWRCGEALLASGATDDRDAATTLLREAAATAERLGAAPLRTAVGDLIERARLNGPPTSRPPEAGPLTPREQSVLELVAEGLTNRQIGVRLYISEKTVSVHLSRVMAKLQVGSRAEAVSAAYLRGLLSATNDPG